MVLNEEEGYNGWKNYETWDVVLWIDNDQGLQEEVLDLGREVAEDAPFADNIKEIIEAMAPELEASMFSDLLNSALSEVDWYELAIAYHAQIKENDEYEEEGDEDV